MAVEFTPRAIKAARKLEQSDRRVAEAMHKRFDELGKNPVPLAAKRVEGAENVYTIPFFGDYGRIIYRITPDGHAKIVLIGPRESVYNEWPRVAN